MLQNAVHADLSQFTYKTELSLCQHFSSSKASSRGVTDVCHHLRYMGMRWTWVHLQYYWTPDQGHARRNAWSWTLSR